MVTQLPFPCIVWATILTSIVFVSTFIIDFLLLTYWIRPRIVFSKPETKIVRQYIVKEDGSIKPVESLPLPPEKQRVVEEKIKVLEEELKREAVQKFTEEWRRNPKLRLRRALVWAGSFAIGIFIASYLSCRLSICPQCVP
uniref:Uncharacterized protein n=1 Tax=Ignisphaera aggregans TaxID=334771 RepID=A0A7J2U609_9CREN